MRLDRIAIVATLAMLACVIGQTNVRAQRLQRPTPLKGYATRQDQHSTPHGKAGKPEAAVQRLFPTVKPNKRLQGTTTRIDLSASELKILGSRDIILFIDKSWSMGTRDCPQVGNMQPDRESIRGMIDEFFSGDTNAISRWKWCAAQTFNLATQIQQVAPNGITLVVFGQDRSVFTNIHPRAILPIFNRTRIGGQTNLRPALKEQLEDYFLRRDNKDGSTVKPLAIAVVTDGLPSDTEGVRHLLIKASQKLRQPHEISVTFLQVGRSDKGRSFLREMDDHLVSQGAAFDIVDTRTFPEVEFSGLARAIIAAISEKTNSSSR